MPLGQGWGDPPARVAWNAAWQLSSRSLGEPDRWPSSPEGRVTGLTSPTPSLQAAPLPVPWRPELRGCLQVGRGAPQKRPGFPFPKPL